MVSRSRLNSILTDAAVALVLAVDVELGIVGAVESAADGGGGSGAADDGTGITGVGGGAAVVEIAEDVSLAILLFVSTGSNFIMGGCDITTGCGGGGAEVFIIGLICVDPTFIVGAFAGDCCIVLITAAVFNIFAKTKLKSIERRVAFFNDEQYRQLTVMLYNVSTIFRDRVSNLNLGWS